jgi:hypothetical protein
MLLFDKYKSDKALASKIVQGDKTAWNEFVNTYSNYILVNIITWCRSTCRIITEPAECAVETLRNPHSAKKTGNTGNTCEEGIELYIYIFNALRARVARYQGKSSLKTFITACLKFIYSDYFIAKHGKINIPVALKDASETDKKVYKVLYRSSDLEPAVEKLEKLGIAREETMNSFKTITGLLEEDGRDKVWHHLYSQFLKNKQVESLELTDENGNESERDITINDADYTNTEVLQLFEKCFKELEAKQQRLLKLKFKDNLSTKEIFAGYGSLFKFEKEPEVYSELDKAIKLLVNKLKECYEVNQGNVDFKEFKETLYDIFKVTGV